MMRPIARIVVAVALVLAGSATLPVSAAYAAGSVESWWAPPAGGSTYKNTYSCTTYQYGVQGKPREVYNSCGTRVWLHYDNISTGQILAYCVNPGGGLAYNFPYPTADIQVTTNASQCDSGSTFSIWWQSAGGPYVEEDTYACQPNRTVTKSGYLIAQARNGCNSRMWLHQNTNGTGNSLCMNNGATTGPYAVQYWQVFLSGNQMGCGAGDPPYSY